MGGVQDRGLGEAGTGEIERPNQTAEEEEDGERRGKVD